MKVLITGLSGFLAQHTALQLLEQGYQVRGTLRDLNRQQSVIDTLISAGAHIDEHNLTFAEADLIADNGWAEAVAGCDYVMHIASPFPPASPQSEDELIIPAREGSLRVLCAARDAAVKRVIVTSSFGAIGYGHPPNRARFTELDWTNEQERGVSAYIRSKTLAERAVWEFQSTEAGEMEICVINPTGIFGPAISPDISTSLGIIKNQLEGRMAICPKIYFGVVDVRDAADLHIKAMRSPNAAGERFLGVAGDCISMFELGQILKRHLGTRAKKVPRFETPNWAIKLISKVNPAAKGVLNDLGNVRLASNEKARQLLGWQPRSTEEAIIATAESLFAQELVNNH